MTMHAHENPSSHGEAQSDRAGRGDRSRHGRPSAQELARLRLKEVAAYVSVDELSATRQDVTEAGVEDDVSSDTKRKRKQRQGDAAASRHQFSVKMPKDDPVLKETIKMVAATLSQDREFHSTLDGLMSDPSLREIVDCAASSPGGTAIIAKAARSGGMLQMAKVADADSELAQCLAQSVGNSAVLNSIRMAAVALAEDREFHGALDALVSNPWIREIVDCAASAPGDAALIAKVARSGDFLQMARVADANGDLAQCLGQLAGDGALLEATSLLVRIFREVAADRSVEEPLRAATAAMRDPAATLRFCEVRKQNGIRARLLDWILGLMQPKG
jgi:hypothetical protein